MKISGTNGTVTVTGNTRNGETAVNFDGSIVTNK